MSKKITIIGDMEQLKMVAGYTIDHDNNNVKLIDHSNNFVPNITIIAPKKYMKKMIFKLDLNKCYKTYW